MAPASCSFPSITVSVRPGIDAAADPLLGDCFREYLARGLHGQAGETGSNQLSAWHGWCTYWCGDNCYTCDRCGRWRHANSLLLQAGQETVRDQQLLE
ncbi:hypothetical protein OEZ86_005833 [Tetradesmus obliquus]|nr:hypothetical protein OEZ86_005833 [Tetradesmus obliquus]